MDAEQRKIKQAIAAEQSEPAEEIVSAKESPKKEPTNEDASLVIPHAVEVSHPDEAQLLDETDPSEEPLSSPD